LDLPFWVARDRGFYRDEGLEAEIVFMRSNLTLQAMTGGSIDFGAATGAAVNAIVSGVDLRVVLAMSDRPMFDLIAHPSITSIQQLRGKKIGFGGIGSLSETIVRQILSVNQIPPDKVYQSWPKQSDLYGAKNRSDRRHDAAGSADLFCAR
jgi:ABC-type nitrate/sulfonate/bicarbonate transport system substrate-binding protein